MSNNYYWIAEEHNAPKVSVTLANGDTIEFDTTHLICEDNPRIHIGKSTAGKFLWAQEPARVREACDDGSNRKMIRDEYGREFTGAEFLTRIEGLSNITKHVGEPFC